MFRTLWPIFVCVVLFVSPFLGAETQKQHPPIKLRAISFEPLVSSPELAAVLKASEVDGNQPGTYLIQFSGPVQPTWKTTITSKGVELLDYVPDFAFKARMSPDQI
jgi:hypothetical protein